MRKLPVIFFVIFFMVLPYLMFKMDLSYSKFQLNEYEKIADFDYENYENLIANIISNKQPEGYVVERNKIYYMGKVFKVENLSEGISIVKFGETSNLIYVKDNAFYTIPKITSYFVFFTNDKKIVNSNNFSVSFNEMFPDVKGNITYYNGKKVLFKIVEKKDLNFLVYSAYPAHHIMLYFVFVPVSLFIIYYFFFYLKRFEREPERKLKKTVKALKILKNIIENCENKDDFKDDIKELKKIFKGD
ncbi:hypothetical protein BG95_00325 [Thermosipho sp. 1063]|uniref:hypothetical protein n=1 Tax=unclassified Thermosipho (in: thermotogales) TaxID=2676525 RepID=UPI0009492DDC|nr:MULTISPECIES: hypothetical protein [unclassified Thermosipho (in: thermotogales)]ANQ52995.1 hypothetical protein Y592_00330 [Thermosipho sp. 1070]APT71442.1 hypothetical protein BG95_00325 [Thermosipho sp. 1063]OOC45518.1 hypothetical protein XO08_00335 [Thermosipho sp. 1074]